MTQKQTSPSYKSKYDFGKINSLSKIAVNYLDEIYEYFGVKRSYNNVLTAAEIGRGVMLPDTRWR